MSVRPTQAADLPDLCAVLDQTALFPAEMLADMIAPFLSDPDSLDLWLTAFVDETPVGFCYAVPAQFADGSWNMLAIAVAPDQQGTGCGGALTTALLGDLQGKGQRVLIAETSGAAAFEGPRAFYLAQGFEQQGCIRDFWAPGDDKVIFWRGVQHG
ncbi:GNAT family N-acetyltransferase [Yoonia sp. SS1-5]|uniref:N-acetyltransferase family protein n=1 Tax=Yoonia rhodophyticola TaxID=3137370 RepID=A0AAN0MLH6_9RHOB